jgi:MFS family permease
MTMTSTRDAAVTAARFPFPAAQRAVQPTKAVPWLRAAFALTVIGWGANQFTPLLLLYRPLMGLTAAVVEAMFGMYAVGLIPGLLVAGRVSDRIGRRPVVECSVLLSIVAGVVLILGPHGVAWLFAGRVIMGVASGCGFSAGAAWIKELSAPPYATAHPTAGARRAGVAMTLGFGLGPLVAGVLAQWAPLPTALPYLPQLALAGWAAVLVWRLPETRPGQADGGGRRFRLAGLSEPRFLRVVLPLAPWVFGSAAIAMVYAPGLVAGRVDGPAVFFGALVALCTAMSGVLIQPVARRLARPGRPWLLVTSLALVTAGMAAEAGVADVGRAVLVLPAAVVLGCGYGCCLVYGLAEVQRIAKPGELAGLTAVFQAATYLGFAAPYVLSMLRGYASPAVLLLGVAALAALTLAVTGYQAARG